MTDRIIITIKQENGEEKKYDGYIADWISAIFSALGPMEQEIVRVRLEDRMAWRNRNKLP